MAEVIEEEVEQKKSGGNLVLILIVVLLVVLLVGGAVAAFFLLGSDNEQQAMSQPQQQSTSQTERKVKRSTDYLSIGPMYPMSEFIVNLLSESGSRYLKVALDIELSSEELAPEMDKKKSLIRDIVIRSLSSKTFEEVSTMKGKDRLKDEIVTKLNDILADGQVKNIFFTDFVVQ